MKKFLILCLFFLTSIGYNYAQTYTGVFKSSSTNTDYHHFIRDNATGAAVYINQVSTGPILRLSSGTSTPNANVKFTIENNGNVGIGTTSPSSNLHLKGDLYIEGTEAYENGWKKNYLYWRGHSLIMGSKPGVYSHNTIELKPGGASQGKLISSLQLYDANNINDQTLKIKITSSGDTYFNGGNVGIGTDNPSNALDVNGTIRATEVKVETGWADFVFESDYNLNSLEEVNTYIQQNGHLPEIPTAKEVEENGISLGEMNAKLLQKIEELTLYTIDQQKAIDKLLERVEKQDTEIESLKNKK